MTDDLARYTDAELLDEVARRALPDAGEWIIAAIVKNHVVRKVRVMRPPTGPREERTFGRGHLQRRRAA